MTGYPNHLAKKIFQSLRVLRYLAFLLGVSFVHAAIASPPNSTWDPSLYGWGGNVFAMVGVIGIGVAICVGIVTSSRENFLISQASQILVYFWWDWIVGGALASWVVLITFVASLLYRDRVESKGSAAKPNEPEIKLEDKTADIESTSSFKRVTPRTDDQKKKGAAWCVVSYGLTHKISGYHLDMHSIHEETEGWFVDVPFPNELHGERWWDFISRSNVDRLQVANGHFFYTCPCCEGQMTATTSETKIPFPLRIKLICKSCLAQSEYLSGQYPDY